MSINKLVASKGFLLNKIDKYLLPSTMADFNSILNSSGRKFYLLGLDVGKRKTGIAITDNLLNTAIPFKITQTKLLSIFLKEIYDNIGQYGLIVGMPLTLSGNLSTSSITICNVLNGMSDLLNKSLLPIWFHDERFTTVCSYSSLKSINTSTLVDDLCAMRILQEHLDLRKQQCTALAGANDFKK